MDQGSKRRGRPVPDAVHMKPIAFKLEEALEDENNYKPNFLHYQNTRNPEEVTLLARDGALHILRFLRIWFDVPQSIFFSAAAYLDLFITKMKVQERYLKCLTISCFYVAAAAEDVKIDIDQLVTVSQSKCSVKDMLRMAAILQQKLDLQNASAVTTCADFLGIYTDILELLPNDDMSELFHRENMLTRLEVIVADNSCSFYRPAVLALVLIQIEIEKLMKERSNFYSLNELLQFLSVLNELQHTCKIRAVDLKSCYGNVANVLKRYDGQDRTAHCQNLLWRFSSSTLAMCNKHRNFQLELYTIDEQNQII